MSVFSLRPIFASVILTGMVCSTQPAHAAPQPAPFSGPNGELTAAVGLPDDGLQTVRILVSSVVGLLPAIQPRSFETAPVEHPWVMWLPEASVHTAWYQLHAVDHALAVSPYILNGGARSAASAGLVFGLSY